MWDRRHLLSVPWLLALCALGAPATSDATPVQDRVILSVTGAISGPGGSGQIDFDLKDLEQLGLTRLTTWTPWTEGEVEFEGA